MANAKNSPVVANQDLSAPYLQQIANCLAYLMVHTEGLKDKSDSELIPILYTFGFPVDAITAILQTTRGTVAVRLTKWRKELEAPKGKGRIPRKKGHQPR